MTATRVLITGSRHWHCLEIAQRVVSRLVDRYGRDDLVIVHGAAPGVDTAFRDAARQAGVRDEPHPAEWQRYHLLAGPIRNAEMVLAGAAFCIACHTNLAEGKGTRNCIAKCLGAGIPVWLIDSEDGEPQRLTEIP